MTPDDLARVRRSWSEIHGRPEIFIERLEAALDTSTCGGPPAADRARRLVTVVAGLVGLLATPSQLATGARMLEAVWAPVGSRPRLDVEGVAWRQAAADVAESWTDGDDLAWHHAWLLIVDVFAEHTLNPFDTAPATDDGAGAATT